MKLALFGERPVFKKPVYAGAPVVEHSVRNDYVKSLGGIFDRNVFTNDGPLVRELEKKIAELHGVRHCVALCNATVAQILVLKALDLHGEICLPPFTFVATAHACLWQNLTPVFCDVRKDGMIDPASVLRVASKKTCAVIGVDLFGNLCDRRALETVCRTLDAKFIVDAAHSFDCGEGARRVGHSGAAEIVSFHATKFFSTFEGGAVLTDDAALDRRLRFLRNFGFRGYDDVGFLGINGKMPEVCAAMGLASLKIREKRRQRLEKNYTLYRRALKDLPGIRLLEVGRSDRSNFHYVVLFVEEAFGVSRDLLLKVLAAENVIARRYFYPGCHRMEPYRRMRVRTDRGLPVTEELGRKVLCLPSWFANPEKSIAQIGRILRAAREDSTRILKWAKTAA